MRCLGNPCIHSQATASFLTGYLVTKRLLLDVVAGKLFPSVVQQRTSGSGSTIPALSRHVTVFCETDDKLSSPRVLGHFII
jgi:hypothetical protein